MSVQSGIPVHPLACSTPYKAGKRMRPSCFIPQLLSHSWGQQLLSKLPVDSSFVAVVMDHLVIKRPPGGATSFSIIFKSLIYRIMKCGVNYSDNMETEPTIFSYWISTCTVSQFDISKLQSGNHLNMTFYIDILGGIIVWILSAGCQKDVLKFLSDPP